MNIKNIIFSIILILILIVSLLFSGSLKSVKQWNAEVPLVGNSRPISIGSDATVTINAISTSYGSTLSTLTVTGLLTGTTISCTGSIAGTTINTGQGANEVYSMNQDIQTTNDVTFKSLTGTYGINGATATITGNISIGGTATITGAVSGATFNSGNGACEIYSMNQGVQTTDEVTHKNITSTYGINGATLTLTSNLSGATAGFSGAVTVATINTGQGDNEVYQMNQNVLTTSDVEFKGATITYGISVATISSSGNITGNLVGNVTGTASDSSLLDGNDSTYFAVKSGTQTFTGENTFAGKIFLTGNADITANADIIIDNFGGIGLYDANSYIDFNDGYIRTISTITFLGNSKISGDSVSGDLLINTSKLNVLGNVGIGNTAPSVKLEVTGALVLGVKTAAQLQALTPAIIGEMWQNSDDVYMLYIATGTAVGSYSACYDKAIAP